ncbi:MAG: hypothetical protein AAGC55_17520, partial [Myxococcota bacterium]
RVGNLVEASTIEIECAPRVVEYLRRNGREYIDDLEKKFQKKIEISGNRGFKPDYYKVAGRGSITSTPSNTKGRSKRGGSSQRGGKRRSGDQDGGRQQSSARSSNGVNEGKGGDSGRRRRSGGRSGGRKKSSGGSQGSLRTES